MTTDDLRTRAREAADERAAYIRALPDLKVMFSERDVYERGFKDGYIDGFHAAQQPSRDIDVDELVVVLHDAACVCDRTTHPAESWVNWTNYARAVVAHLTKGDESDE